MNKFLKKIDNTLENNKISNHFSLQLTSLRAIACLIVVIYHCLTMYPINKLIIHSANFDKVNIWSYILVKVLYIIFNGHAAVTFFFILSAILIGKNFQNINLKSITNFYIKRFIRLIPTMWISIIIGLIFIYYIQPFQIFPSAASGLNIWYKTINIPNMYYMLTAKYPYFNPVIWTLHIELLAIIFLPLFIILLKYKYSKIWLYITAACFYINKSSFDYYANIYIVDFIIGLSALQWGPILIKFINSRSKYFRKIALSLCYLLIILPRPILVNYSFWIINLLESIGSSCLICYLLFTENNFKILNNKILLFIGKISYSIYLIHYIIVFSLTYFISLKISPQLFAEHSLTICGLIILICLPLSILLGYIYYQLFERPFINLSKKLKIFKYN